MRSKLRELEALGAKLSATAGKLPPGQDRQDAFREISKFRDKIAVLKTGGAFKARKRSTTARAV
jgi:hypothetical protein